MMTASLAFEDATIPAELKAHPHWVCWKAVPNGERIEKIPMCASTGNHASSTNHDTWTDYSTAAMQASTHDALGLGFVFVKAAGIVGIDLDKCRDAHTGALEPWAEEIVRDLNSYTEISPSGTGLHVYALGTLPPGKRKKGRIEVYEHARFFTVTGNHLPGTPATIEDRTDQLAAFHARYFADPEPQTVLHSSNGHPACSLSDQQIVAKCRTAKNAAKFEALWGEKWKEAYQSQSEADLALLGILKFYTQDAGQLDRLFRQSGLMRTKWDEQHGQQTYGEGTIAEALAHVRETYSPHDVHTSTLSGLSVTDPGEWPEPTPIKAELLPVEPLPLSIVPLPFRAWIKDVSDRMQCPADFVAAAMLVMTGSIIGAGCGIRPKKADDWMVIPNLWGGVVGRPSMMKTPAIAEAMKPMDALTTTAKQDFDTVIKEHLAEMEAFKARREAIQSSMRLAAKGNAAEIPSMECLKNDFTHLEEPKPPVWRRYVTNDATIEKMAELQASNPRGLMLFRDELVGLFASWDKDGHEADRTFYLEGWNGDRSHTSDRIGRGTTHVNNLCISLFGGIQPAKLMTYLHAAMRGQNNDGLVQRLQVLVYPNEPKSWTLIDRPIDAMARQAAFQAVERLATMDFRQYGAFSEEGRLTPYFRFTDEAQGRFKRSMQHHLGYGGVGG